MTDWAQNKKEYREFCEASAEMLLFFQDWWLDLVCTKGEWQVCLEKDHSGSIQGVLPFYLSGYFGFKVIKMPVLTPYLGIWLKPMGLLKPATAQKREKKIVEALIEQLPKVAYYAQRHPVSWQNWLPFYWKGFQQTTLYTFRITPPIDLKRVFSAMKSNTRNKISKAKKIVEIIETEDIDLFYRINQLTFARQSKAMPYSLALIKKLDQALSDRKRRKILLAKDANGEYHGGIYLVWDKTAVYNLMLGADSQLRNSGAVQLLLWEGIKLAAEKNCTFDFEGTMMQNIEGMFRSFGGQQVPYHKIYKANTFLAQIVKSFR